MAHIERRVRNGKTSYRARYRDPAGREHAKVFARKADAQRFLTEMENSKLKGAWRGRVDLERGTVQVIEIITEPRGHLHFGPPRTSAGRRTVGLPRFVVDALGERMAGPGSAEELVFAGPHGGPLRVTLFRQRFWLPAIKAAGLDGLHIHDLRHTAVALWIAAGANPKEVAARAGHASVSFTLDRYGHLYPEADLNLRERLDAIWSASGGGQ